MQTTAAIEIGHAERDASLLGPVRELFREYEAGLGIDLSFQQFDLELASLPGAYAAPAGCLLLARVAGELAGCAGVRPFAPGTAELKRLYVRPHARGLGAARALADAALRHARTRRYARVVLDTLPTMDAALSLYGSLGFRDIEPYRVNPIAGTRFMGLDLGGGSPAGRGAA